jgi:hypothetical protein
MSAFVPPKPKPKPKPPVKPKPKPKAKATPKPKATASNSYMDSITKMQQAQNDALLKMWGKDKGRKKVQIRTQ